MKKLGGEFKNLDRCYLVLSIPAKFEGRDIKIVGGVIFFCVTSFFKKHYCQFSPQVC